MEKRLTADLNVVANSNLEIQLLDGDLNIIQKLDDEPNDVGGLTSAELKAKFDESGNIIKKYINEILIPAILADDATEESRKQAEAARVAAEQGRVTAEEGRVSAEAARAATEQARSEAESSRVSAENAREAAEQARADETAGIVARATAQANAAAGSASQAAGSEQSAKDAAGTATGAASSASQSAAAASGSASQASAAAAAAAQSAANGETANKNAQSWAVGGTGTRPGEDTNNAKYWAEHAEAVAGGDFATKSEAQGYVTAHNENVEAHHDLRVAVAGSVRYDEAQSLTDEQKAQARGNINAAPGGFGLGGLVATIPANANLNDYIRTGFFGNGNTSVIRTWVNTPVNWPANEAILEVYTLGKYAIQRLSSVTTKVSAQRSLLNDVWAEWEWINPPMATADEYSSYRTIERYKGEPIFKGRLGDFEVWQHGSEADNTKWQSTGKSVMYKIAAGATKNIALNANRTFVVSCCDNVRRGVAIVQVEGQVVQSITPIVPLSSWVLEAGSGLTVNVSEKDTRFDMFVYIKML